MFASFGRFGLTSPWLASAGSKWSCLLHSFLANLSSTPVVSVYEAGLGRADWLVSSLLLNGPGSHDTLTDYRTLQQCFVNISTHLVWMTQCLFFSIYMHWESKCKSITRHTLLYIMCNSYLLSIYLNIPSELDELRLWWWGCCVFALVCLQKLDPVKRANTYYVHSEQS